MPAQQQQQQQQQQQTQAMVGFMLHEYKWGVSTLVMVQCRSCRHWVAATLCVCLYPSYDDRP
jgi:hypothetical protein